MKRLLIIFPPFCVPTSPPYSLGYLKRFIKKNADITTELLDLNLLYHLKTSKNPFRKDIDVTKYDKISSDFMTLMQKKYDANNRVIRDGKDPELANELLQAIKSTNPDFVAFSCFYNQQMFYATYLSKKLRVEGIKSALGGPAAAEEYLDRFDTVLNDEFELLNWLSSQGIDTEKEIAIEKPTLNFDFKGLDLDSYFAPERVLPIRSSRGCYHNKCAFCTHSAKIAYYQISPSKVREEIIGTNCKYFQFIDDMISPQRLETISDEIKDLNIVFSALTKPNKEFTLERMKKIRSAGCRLLIWGVESGSQKVLDKMRKGTTIEECKNSLKNAHEAGIKNLVYIMFGFPGETKEDFLSTLDFLQENSQYIDIISTSVFGLQKGAPIFKKPDEYGVTDILEHKRTILPSSFTYSVKEGLSHEEVVTLKKKFDKKIKKLNKYPKTFSYFRDHFLYYIGK